MSDPHPQSPSTGNPPVDPTVCGIYETRPEVCRHFDCQGDGRVRLLALGLRPPTG